MAELGGRKDVDLEINLLRHMVLNTIRSYHTKFKRDYGELVIACDNKRYWRKEIFPNYKANRKKAREDSGYDWNVIFDAINQIKKELKDIFPYRVIEVDNSEADDIIATLCKKFNSEPILIISGDHDFIQLHRYNNVKQYSPIQKKFVKSDLSSDEVVLEHIIKGDKGDGIPNVLTSDDAIINGERQKPISSKKLAEWLKDPTTMPHDDAFVRNYKRNQLLVDLSRIPQHIEDSILNTFTSYPQKDKSMILDYFIEHKMKHMVEHIEEF
jgi:hypothetical protein